MPVTLTGMEITVCICTHDRPAYVRDCLDGLARQTTDLFEVLVVDSASTGDVPARLADLATAYGASLVRVTGRASAPPATPAPTRRARRSLPISTTTPSRPPTGSSPSCAPARPSARRPP